MNYAEKCLFSNESSSNLSLDSTIKQTELKLNYIFVNMFISMRLIC
jgi:hypothetical protein